MPQISPKSAPTRANPYRRPPDDPDRANDPGPGSLTAAVQELGRPRILRLVPGVVWHIARSLTPGPANPATTPLALTPSLPGIAAPNFFRLRDSLRLILDFLPIRDLEVLRGVRREFAIALRVPEGQPGHYRFHASRAGVYLETLRSLPWPRQTPCGRDAARRRGERLRHEFLENTDAVVENALNPSAARPGVDARKMIVKLQGVEAWASESGGPHPSVELAGHRDMVALHRLCQQLGTDEAEKDLKEYLSRGEELRILLEEGQLTQSEHDALMKDFFLVLARSGLESDVSPATEDFYGSIMRLESMGFAARHVEDENLVAGWLEELEQARYGDVPDIDLERVGGVIGRLPAGPERDALFSRIANDFHDAMHGKQITLFNLIESFKGLLNAVTARKHDVLIHGTAPDRRRADLARCHAWVEALFSSDPARWAEVQPAQVRQVALGLPTELRDALQTLWANYMAPGLPQFDISGLRSFVLAVGDACGRAMEIEGIPREFVVPRDAPLGGDRKPPAERKGD